MRLHPSRRLIGAGAVGLLMIAGLGVVASPGNADTPSCKIENLRTGAKYTSTSGSALAMALGVAASGDAIQIKGICIGNFRITRSVSLIGKPDKTSPIPTLSGAGATPNGSVLTVAGSDTPRVDVRDLLITGGTGTLVSQGDVPWETQVRGGGIYAVGARVSLLGMSSVSGNRTVARCWDGTQSCTWLEPGWSSPMPFSQFENRHGGGIYLAGGSLTLADSASVFSNSTSGYQFYSTGFGGGIYNVGGNVGLSGTSTLKGNDQIGLVNIGGTVLMTGSASIQESVGSAAGSEGGPGGVANGGRFEMQDHATVRNNHGLLHWAGGIANTCWNWGSGQACTPSLLILGSGTSVVDNSAEWSGGGAGISGGFIIFQPGSTVSGNRVGGVAACPDQYTGDTSGVTGNDPYDFTPC